MIGLYTLRNFSAFTAIGGVFFALAVGINAIAIDFLALNPAAAPFLILSGLFVAKYYVYLFARVIVPSFWRYTVANFFVSFLSAVTIWLMVDYGGVSGALSTAISLGFFFILRYVVLHFSNVIRRAPQD